MNVIQFYLDMMVNMLSKDYSKTDSSKDIESESNNQVTGYDVTYIVPDDMKKMKVRLMKKNGTLKSEYTLTDYLDIKSGEKFRIFIER